MRLETGHLATLRQRQAQALERTLLCIKLVQHCTDLIDELQRERGLGQMLRDQVTENHAAALREQIQCSTDAEQALRQQLLRLEQAPSASEPELSGLIRLGQALLPSPGPADLTARHRHMLLAHGWHEQMFEVYCQRIAQLLGLVEAAGQASGDPELTQELATLGHLMWCKEYSGQERAHGAGLFASGCHDARIWQRIARLIETQQRCASEFISRASPGARKRVKNSLQLETQIELEALRQQLADSPELAPLDTAMGEIWFRRCSRRMNELREIERSLLQDLLQQVIWQQARWGKIGAATETPGAARLPAGAVETVLRTAAAWLADASPGARPQEGRTA